MAHVQLPAELVHCPELRKFGLGLMLADGLAIRNVTGAVGAVVVVVGGAIVVVVVGAGVVVAGGAFVVVGGVEFAAAVDGCVFFEAVVAIGDLAVETRATGSVLPVRCDDFAATWRALTMLDEFSLTR